MVAEAVARNGDGEALVCGATRMTWREVARQTAQIAAGFQKLGLQRGDRVAVLLGNRTEFVLTMLGAAHACANPLTKNYGIIHGDALAVLLPHVVRWNACPEYSEFHPDLSSFLRDLATGAGLAATLRSFGVPKDDLPRLSEEAAEQWTGKFNPRPLNALEIYECAW